MIDALVGDYEIEATSDATVGTKEAEGIFGS